METYSMSKRLKDKIEKLEQKHRVIADNLLDAIWIVDAETLKFEYITPSIEKIRIKCCSANCASAYMSVFDSNAI